MWSATQRLFQCEAAEHGLVLHRQTWGSDKRIHRLCCRHVPAVSAILGHALLVCISQSCQVQQPEMTKDTVCNMPSIKGLNITAMIKKGPSLATTGRLSYHLVSYGFNDSALALHRPPPCSPGLLMHLPTQVQAGLGRTDRMLAWGWGGKRGGRGVHPDILTLSKSLDWQCICMYLRYGAVTNLDYVPLVLPYVDPAAPGEVSLQQGLQTCPS